jgi:hypothetical protein
MRPIVELAHFLFVSHAQHTADPSRPPLKTVTVTASIGKTDFDRLTGDGPADSSIRSTGARDRPLDS